jgi:hypothetical protein
MSEASYKWESPPLCTPSLISACFPARFHELQAYNDREVTLLCKLYESIILGDTIWSENPLLIRDLLHAVYVSAPDCNDLSLPFHRENIMPMIGISSPLLNAGSCILPN